MKKKSIRAKILYEKKICHYSTGFEKHEGRNFFFKKIV